MNETATMAGSDPSPSAAAPGAPGEDYRAWGDAIIGVAAH